MAGTNDARGRSRTPRAASSLLVKLAAVSFAAILGIALAAPIFLHFTDAVAIVPRQLGADFGAIFEEETTVVVAEENNRERAIPKRVTSRRRARPPLGAGKTTAKKTNTPSSSTKKPSSTTSKTTSRTTSKSATKTATKTPTTLTTTRSATKTLTSTSKTTSKSNSQTQTRTNTPTTKTNTPTTSASKTATRTTTAPAPTIVNAASAQSPLSLSAGYSVNVTVDLPSYCASSCYIYGFLGLQQGSFASAQVIFQSASASSVAATFTSSQVNARSSQTSRLFALDASNNARTSACPSGGSFACKLILSITNAGSSVLLGLANVLVDGNPIQNANSVANVTSRMTFALATGNSSLVTGNEIRSRIYQEVTNANWMQDALQNIWGTTSGWSSASGATWNPTHESVQYTINDASSVLPVAIGNYDYAGGGPTKAKIIVAGKSLGGLGGKFVAFAANPLHDFNYTGRDTLWNAAFQTYVKNAFKWVTDSTSPGKITLAHIEDSYWFHHDTSSFNTLTKFYPSATISAINSCENTNLASCLSTSDLLVISSSTDGNTDLNVVASAVTEFALKGKPVVYVHFGSYDNSLFLKLLPIFSLSYSGSNYWNRAGLSNADISWTNSSLSGVDSYKRIIDTLTTVSPLTLDDMDGCFTGAAAIWDGCANATFKYKIRDALLDLKSTLNSLDNAGTDLFSLPGRILPKLMVLLGDKYRADTNNADPGSQALWYPISFGQNMSRFAGAMMADTTLLYLRAEGSGQGDLGTLVCPNSRLRAGTCYSGGFDIRSYASSVSLATYNITLQLLPGDSWTSTGLFALPGRQVSVTRLDNNTEISLGIRFWFQRAGTTKALYTSLNTVGPGGDGGSMGNNSGVIDTSPSNFTRYERPQWAQSPSVKLAPPNSTTVVTPYLGGPVYIQMSGVDTYRNAGKDGSITLRLQISGVAKHASILDVTDTAQINDFIANARNNIFPVVDLKGDGFEIHLRKDKFWDGIINRTMTETGQAADAPKMNYAAGATGLRAALDDFRLHFFQNQYIIAGWKPPGLTLNQSIPAETQAICAYLNWTDCWDATLNKPFNVQHTNYDEDANCGDGCSGNPWDADWEFKTVGWGEGHELGHNMQKWWFNLQYGTDANKFSTFVSRAGENSNNVFPYANKWRWFRIVNNYNGYVDDGHVNHRVMWSIAQSAYLNITATINNELKRVFYDENCKLISHFPLSTSPQDAIYLTIYGNDMNSNGNYVAFEGANSARMIPYHQIPAKFSGVPLADNKTVIPNSGFQWIGLMYTLGRMIDKYGASEALWNANRDRLGFGLYNKTNATTGNDIRSIHGAEMFIVGLSYVSGRDWRPLFDVWGIRYSDLARAQVEAHVNAGRIREAVPTTFAVMDWDILPNPTHNVTWIPFDTYTLWPKGNWHPNLCFTDGRTKTKTATTTATITRTSTTSVTRTIATMAASITVRHATAALNLAASATATYTVTMPYACTLNQGGCSLEALVNVESGSPAASAHVQSFKNAQTPMQVATTDDVVAQGIRVFSLTTSAIQGLDSVCTTTEWQQGDCQFVVKLWDNSNAVKAGLVLVADTQGTTPTTGDLDPRVARALILGDSSYLTASELKQVLLDEADSVKDLARNSVSSVWNGVSTLTYDPSHDSMEYKIVDSTFAWPVFTSNWRFHATVGPATELVVPGGATPTGSRFMAWPSSPFWNNMAGISNSADLTKVMQNSIAWLNKGTDPAKVVTAHLPGSSSYWFSYDTPTTNALKAWYPSASINAINACENGQLRGCLSGADVLIIGNQMGRDGDSAAPSATVDVPAILSAVKDFMEGGGSVLFTPYGTGTSNLTDGILALMGLGYRGTGYWDQFGMNASTYSASTADPLAKVRAAVQTATGSTPLTDSDIASCYNSVTSWNKCTAANWTSKIGDGLAQIRGAVNTTESAGNSMFARPSGLNWLKLAVLLGDKFHVKTGAEGNATALTFPIPRSSPSRFAGAGFADATISYVRSKQVLQLDAGSLYCSRASLLASTCQMNMAQAASFAQGSQATLSGSVPASDGYVFSTYFAIPGQSFTVTRNDQAGANLNVYLAFFASTGTAASFTTDANNYTFYDRPIFANSYTGGPLIALPNGKAVTVSHPFGGTIALVFSNTASAIQQASYSVSLSSVVALSSWNQVAGTSVTTNLCQPDTFMNLPPGTIAPASSLSDVKVQGCVLGTTSVTTGANRTGALFPWTSQAQAQDGSYSLCAIAEGGYWKIVALKVTVSGGVASWSKDSAKYCTVSGGMSTTASLTSDAVNTCYSSQSATSGPYVIQYLNGQMCPV